MSGNSVMVGEGAVLTCSFGTATKAQYHKIKDSPIFQLITNIKHTKWDKQEIIYLYFKGVGQYYNELYKLNLREWDLIPH